MDIKIFRDKLWKYLPNFYKDEKFSDFKFLLSGGERMNGHKFLLLLCCDGWNVKDFDSMSVLDLSGYRRITSELFIKWVYTGIIHTDDITVWKEMLEISVSFNLSILYERCQVGIEDNDQNVVDMVRKSGNLHMDSRNIADYQGETVTLDTHSEAVVVNPRRKSQRALISGKQNNPKSFNTKMQYCQLCEKNFSTHYNLKKHLHSSDHKRKVEDYNVNNNGVECDKCNVCGLILNSQFHLEQHLIFHNSKTCNGQNWRSGKPDSNLPVTRGEKLYSSDQFSIKNDQEIHNSDKKVSCEVCLKDFFSEAKLQKHSASHTKLKTPQCGVCNKIFKTSQNLNRHLRLHTGEKPYLCSHCGQGFIQFTQLKVHLRGHSGERPYHCDHCSKKFASKFVYKQHLDTHSTGLTKYICHVCGLGFNRQSNCQRHIQLHTNSKPYKCDQCGKAYSKKHSLKMHKHQALSSVSCRNSGLNSASIIPVSMATVTVTLSNSKSMSVPSIVHPLISNDYINVQSKVEI